MIALADLEGLDDAAVKAHILKEWEPTPHEAAVLDRAVILLAYESVGSWGCDSSGFYLISVDGELYEINGGHCSCYGFEGQWLPEATSKEALVARPYFSMGGYDEHSTENEAAIRSFAESLP